MKVWKWNRWFLVPFALGMFLSVYAAKTGTVKFDQQGGKAVSEAFLTANTRVRSGLEFKQDQLDADIKWLFETGNFADVSAETKKNADGTIDVTFHFRSAPRISRLDFKGNAKFSSKEILKHLKIEEGGLLNGKLLRETLSDLRKMYTENGYKDARVDPVITPDGKGGVHVTIIIDEKLRLKVHDVTFPGASLFSQRELRGLLANRYSYFNWVPFLNDYLNYGLLDRPELDLDKARLRDHYHDAGYLDFKVKNIKLSPLAKDPEYVDIAFEIEEGKPYKVSGITISGNTAFKKEILEGLLKLHKGDTFSRTQEQLSSRAITSLYDANGYADFICQPRRTEDFSKHTVAIDFHITEGRKHFVRDVIIRGNTSTKDKVIRRELAIQPGDPVSRDRVEVSRQRLLGMGYFTKVTADTVNAEALNEKDVRITVEEKPERYNFRIGAGASDVNSFFGMAEISTDNFDITNPKNWFYGGGQRLRLQGIYGITNAGFNVNFVEPWLFDIPLRFELSGYMNGSSFEDWDELHTGGRTSLQKKIFDDFTTVALGYKFEVVRLTNESHRLEAYFEEYDQHGNHLVSQPSLMLARDTRDSLIDPTEGYNINLFTSVTPRIFGSSHDYYRLEAKGSYYISFFEKAIVAMIGGKIGVVGDFGYSKDVPMFERYYLGGSDQLRGFEYRTVGPHVNGENVGGQSMLLLTAEVTHPIWGPVRGALFSDIGNAWGSAYNFSFSELNIGVGYGLRVKVPMIQAPLKLDLAFPVLNNVDDESSKLRIHFNVGVAF